MVPKLDDTLLQFRDQVRNFGILLDPALSQESHIAIVSRSTFNQIRLIAQLHPYLDEDSLRTLVQALVISQTDYCSALHVGLPLNLTLRLQRLQKGMLFCICEGFHGWDLMVIVGFLGSLAVF